MLWTINIPHGAQWCQYYPSQMLDANTINQHVGTGYWELVNRACLFGHSSLHILFQPQQMFRKIIEYDQFQSTPQRRNGFYLSMLYAQDIHQCWRWVPNCGWHPDAPGAPHSNANSTFTFTSWKPLLYVAVRWNNGIRGPLWVCQMLWRYNERNAENAKERIEEAANQSPRSRYPLPFYLVSHLFPLIVPVERRKSRHQQPNQAQTD